MCVCGVLSVEMKTTDLSFLPWSSSFELLHRLFLFASSPSSSTLTSGDAVLARTIEIRMADDEYCTG